MSYNPNASGTPTSSKSVTKVLYNNTGGTILLGTPARVDTLGQIGTINVSSEADIAAIAGIVKSNINNASSGEVVSFGVVEGITTTASVGDSMFISKSGGLTNIKPSIGVAGFVAGDWVIRVGVVSKNVNPLVKDLIVSIQIIGSL